MFGDFKWERQEFINVKQGIKKRGIDVSDGRLSFVFRKDGWSGSYEKDMIFI